MPVGARPSRTVPSSRRHERGLPVDLEVEAVLVGAERLRDEGPGERQGLVAIGGRHLERRQLDDAGRHRVAAVRDAKLVDRPLAAIDHVPAFGDGRPEEQEVRAVLRALHPAMVPHGVRAAWSAGHPVDHEGGGRDSRRLRPPSMDPPGQLTLMTTNGFESGWTWCLPSQIRPTGSALPAIEPEICSSCAHAVLMSRPSIFPKLRKR